MSASTLEPHKQSAEQHAEGNHVTHQQLPDKQDLAQQAHQEGFIGSADPSPAVLKTEFPPKLEPHLEQPAKTRQDTPDGKHQSRGEHFALIITAMRPLRCTASSEEVDYGAGEILLENEVPPGQNNHPAKSSPHKEETRYMLAVSSTLSWPCIRQSTTIVSEPSLISVLPVQQQHRAVPFICVQEYQGADGEQDGAALLYRPGCRPGAEPPKSSPGHRGQLRTQLQPVPQLSERCSVP